MTASKCVDCKRPRGSDRDGKMRGGRGLCRSCYERHHRHGDIYLFPRLNRSADEVLDEWVFFHDQGYSVRSVAELLDMKYPSFRRVLIRAHLAGDERADGFGYQGVRAA